MKKWLSEHPWGEKNDYLIEHLMKIHSSEKQTL